MGLSSATTLMRRDLRDIDGEIARLQQEKRISQREAKLESAHYNDTNVYNLNAAPTDPEALRMLQEKLNRLSAPQLMQRLSRQVREGRGGYVPGHLTSEMITRVLDTSVGTTGNVLPRVDLEQTVRALFVKRFPFFDRIKKEPSNGLVHTWDVMSVAGSSSDATLSLATELTTVTDDTGTYKQFNNANISVFDTQRGTSLKELFVVRQSGMSYSPETMEIFGGTVMLQKLVQKLIFQGNFSVSAGAGSNTELGANSTAFFDGLRLITSQTAPYNVPVGAVKVDLDQGTQGGPFTHTQAVNLACGKVIDQGGMPSLLVCSATRKVQMMNEQEGKQRTLDSELIPGVMVNTLATIAGDLPIMMVPGASNALGSYARSSDSVPVEDLYVLDEDNVYLRYVGSPDINVLEIPVGVDGKLSRRFILFCMYGLQVADNGAFQAKVRCPL